MSFTRKLISVEVRLGFLRIPSKGLDLMPEKTGKIDILLDGEKKKFHYNADYHRIFGLTAWYKKNKAIPTDEILVEKINENAYRLSFKKGKPDSEEEIKKEEAKELIDLSGLSSSAKGDIVEDRIKELILLHGLGEMSVYKPVTDTEGIDLIIVKNGMFQPLFLQVKSRFNLQKNGSFIIDIRMKTFNPHHSYYAIGAYFNPEKMEIDDHILFIPTKELEKKANIVNARNEKRYRVTTRLTPDSRGKWKDYIIKKTELAEKLIEKFSEMSTYLK